MQAKVAHDQDTKDSVELPRIYQPPSGDATTQFVDDSSGHRINAVPRLANLEHPSNQLTNGQVDSPRHALLLMIEQFRHEAELCDRFALDRHGDPPAAEMRQAEQRARQLLDEYDRAMVEAERQLFQRWLGSDDAETGNVGKALLNRRFEDLAA